MAVLPADQRARGPVAASAMASDPAAGSAVSPLEEIEARVQARAKDLLLDLGTTGDRAILRELVEDEIGAWASQYQRGLRDHDLASPELVADRVLRNLAGYGPLQPLLADDDVWDIMVRPYADLAVCP